MPDQNGPISLALRPTIMAKGLGGYVELNGEFIRIVRKGFINYILSILSGSVPRVTTVIPLERVATVGIVEPLILNNFMVVAFPGSPPMTGRMFRDAMAENALLLNFFDNRKIYSLVREAEKMIYRRDIFFTEGMQDWNGNARAGNGNRPPQGDAEE